MISPISYKPYNNVIAFRSAHRNPVMKEAVDVSRMLETNGYNKTEQAYYAFLDSEINELKMAKAHNDFKNMEEEVGDVLFDTIMLADHYGIDPAKALSKTNKKLKSRIEKAQELADKPLTEYSFEDRLIFWDIAKLELRKNEL